jgi:hypothetical protein
LEKNKAATEKYAGETQVRLQNVRVGNCTVSDPLCAVMADADDIRVGLGFLRHFDVTFWFGAGKMRIEPAGDNPVKEPAVFSMGLSPQQLHGPYWTLCVAESLPAARAGILTGAILTEVNGKDAANLTYGAVSRLLTPEEPKTGAAPSVAVTVRQGDDTLTAAIAPEKVL